MVKNCNRKLKNNIGIPETSDNLFQILSTASWHAKSVISACLNHYKNNLHQVVMEF